MEQESFARDSECRSLLQKAVRRGHPVLVSKVAAHLWRNGGEEWLKRRTAVILAEECWPLLKQMPAEPTLPTLVGLLAQATTSRKRKDAFGLAGLRGYWEQDKRHRPALSPQSLAVLEDMVATSHLGRRLWPSLRERASSSDAMTMVEAAHRSSRRMTGEFDKALMAAAAIAAIHYGTPDVPRSDVVLPLPPFVALDRHTGPGKLALLELSGSTGVSLDVLYTLNFWCEGASLNEEVDSELHRAVKQDALNSIGMTADEAQALWNRLRPAYETTVASAARIFRDHIKGVVGVSIAPDLGLGL